MLVNSILFLSFIDDLIAVNDNREFDMNIKNIYPKKLELKKENSR